MLCYIHGINIYSKLEVEIMSPKLRRRHKKKGRPTLYEKSMVDQTRNLIVMGYTHEDVAEFYKVNVSSIYLWKTMYPDFSDALDFTKDEYDSNVVRSLYQVATGYTERTRTKQVDEEGNIKIVRTKKKVAPNIGAIKVWLYNRRPDEWKPEAELVKQKHDDTAPAPSLNINYIVSPPVKDVKITIGK